jgi:chemotaxis protein methyltransferase CheR
VEQGTFEKFSALIYQRCGITLGQGKASLVSARIARRMRELNLDSEGAYYHAVLGDQTGKELAQLIDAVSTNFTGFFREPGHFETLGKLLAMWKKQGQRRFRIWCAAAATGEEPYTLAMTARETLDSGGLDVKILATDISSRVLQKCREGLYDGQRIATVSADLRQKYFAPLSENGRDLYEVNESLRSILFFRKLNLSQPPFPMQGPFDVVFCRNVMIYFDNRVRARLLTEIYKLLKVGGYLMVGHAETLTGLNIPFRTVRPSVYVK